MNSFNRRFSLLLMRYLGQSTLPLLDNPFSERLNAIIQKTREMRRGVYHPHLYIVKEDGEPPLRLWALSNLIQDRADVLPSYQQYINQLKDRVGPLTDSKNVSAG
jgi:protein transport protein SEC24